MKSSIKWKITNKRFVACIDIMGFKDMVARNSHTKIYSVMKSIEKSRESLSKLKWGLKETVKGSSLIKTTTYSDSIMIYSKDNSYESLQSFICTVSILTNDLFIKGIPHKGAFAFGKMTLDKKNSIFFGQPLIDAYLLQEQLNFYGVIGHATAEKEIDRIVRRSESDLFFIMDYDCPFKNGIYEHLTIYPLNAEPNEKDFKKHSAALYRAIRKLRLQTSGHLRKYIENTELYIECVRETWQ